MISASSITFYVGLWRYKIGKANFSVQTRCARSNPDGLKSLPQVAVNKRFQPLDIFFFNLYINRTLHSPIV